MTTRIFVVIALIVFGPGAAAAAVCQANKAADLNFTLNDIDGKAINVSEFKGKVLILDFWATWCKACAVEIPAFVDLQNRYGANGLQVIGISVDDSLDKLIPYAAKFKINYPVLVGRDRRDVIERFKPVTILPTAVVIARDGTVCRKHSGETKAKVFEDEIKSLL